MSQSLRNRAPVSVSGISLRQLLPRAEFIGSPDIRVSSCSADSRQCQQGDLFVAVVGANTDGHDHIEQALDRGARAVLTERLLPGDFPQCIVPDTRIAYGRVCQALAGRPTQQLKVIGVTGTNGKTTTSCLIASILQTAGFQPGLLGTLGYCDGVANESAPLTTPSAPVLASWLARMAANGCTHAVMEVSSHALAQHRVAGMQFDAACVTNVRRDHLDFHGTLVNYRKAKRRLFKHLSPEGFCVLNADDPVCTGYLNSISNPVLTVGLNNHAELTATLIERSVSEQTFLLHAGNESVPVRTRMIGDHHISNCLVAAAVGLTYGIELNDVVRGLEAIDHVPGRLERIECGQPFAAFVDYAHTPDALAFTLKTLREVTKGRLICLFGAGGDRDRQKRPLMGRCVEQMADDVIVTTDNPRHEDPANIAREILSGCEHPSGIELVRDRAAAIARALGMAREGDCVVIAGKGHEDYQLIGRRRLQFDDREVVRNWLQQNFKPSLQPWQAAKARNVCGNS
jgi:UDP-N-acetylmuramoyl-L-alanyl-D-glutamate--2,6-diaminopimelate ligase